MSNLYNQDDIYRKLGDIENKFDDIKYELKGINEEIRELRGEQGKVINKLEEIKFLIPNHQRMRLAVSEGIIIGGIFLFIIVNGYNYWTR